MRTTVALLWLPLHHLLLTAALAVAEATLPTRDIPGAGDNPLLRRYDGLIITNTRQAVEDFDLPNAKLKQVPGKTAKTMTSSPANAADALKGRFNGIGCSSWLDHLTGNVRGRSDFSLSGSRM